MGPYIVQCSGTWFCSHAAAQNKEEEGEKKVISARWADRERGEVRRWEREEKRMYRPLRLRRR